LPELMMPLLVEFVVRKRKSTSLMNSPKLLRIIVWFSKCILQCNL
ncbi:hypothetical protein T12_7662, partial [Trichinella patagoniensis]